ncbi:tyrosine-protein kinase FRK-like [Orbicella faveolata]|uniref:tyrosine-protein kinase FRK-like n=1 Tax=Orbicella faveolata TaxID=48498 RepID=UPI0009E44361|nr:tyrosine-protein kinase FRK-like [Orbicella faveolata]
MPKPQHVDKSLYDIMVRCWNVNPDFRPPFENLRKRMESYIRDTTYLELINMDEYDSSKYAKVEDEGGENIREHSQEAKSSGKKRGARRCASVRQ